LKNGLAAERMSKWHLNSYTKYSTYFFQKFIHLLIIANLAARFFIFSTNSEGAVGEISGLEEMQQICVFPVLAQHYLHILWWRTRLYLMVKKNRQKVLIKNGGVISQPSAQ
jgi:hypothetical protein